MSHSNASSGASHGSVKTYMTGFILSIILTVIPFWMVMTGAASPAVILGTILAMAVVQILVHLVCFLHMNTKSDEGWMHRFACCPQHMTAFVFTVLIIAILVVGSIWIMWNLNYNMMMH
ncbi:cytochrome o ubiquinol oxidase subunit IV [Escherichia coli]|uniref:Cytochrome bo(3) ubiquinol oxidase subunit 4 n=1 Tax=Escherichia coli TaxID=562 RepID=A0A8S0G0A2_ECOLX|nr:cytochrome o ubiquinol oxidase subunit IV [Escherichia coli]